jgi:sodium transport system permease protein
MYPVPLLGQHMLAADVLGGKPAPLWAFLLAGAAALVIAMLTMRMTTHMLQRERIIFSR